MIELSVDELWEVIYASRDSEKYWRSRRRFGDDIYSPEELELKFQDAKERL